MSSRGNTAVGIGAPSSRMSGGGAAASSSSPLHSSLSTRDQLLQRYSNRDQTDGKQQAKIELFESGDVQENAYDNSHATRSDRSLLLSSGGVSGVSKKLGGGGGVGASSVGGGSGVEDVDSTRVRPAVAFQTFAGALYTGSGSLGGIGGDKNVSLFESGSNALVAGGSGGAQSKEDSQSIRLKFESPFVKLQRLQDELKEFHVELREAAASAPKSGGGGGEASAQADIWSNLSGNVQQLQGQLDAMLSQPQVKQMMLQTGAGDAGVASVVSNSSLLPQFDSLFDQYVAELTANPSFQPFPAPAASVADPSSSSTVASSPELVALPKLDERLNVLEKLLGTSAGSKQAPALPLLAFNAAAPATSSASAAAGGATAPSTSVLPAPDLLTALASLHAQMSQLNPQRLEFISRSCKQILIEQESIALSAKQIKEDALSAGSSAVVSPKAANNNETPAVSTTAADAAARPYAAQIAHLYALTSRWDTLALTLPTLIARLSSLHTLHASSATLVARVSGLERQSSAIDAAIAAQREGMQAVSKAAADNLAAIHDNFKAMDARIQQLTKKMEQLK